MEFYVQITDRCNMTCAHCALSCTKKGTDMDMATFEAACKVVINNSGSIIIGGGEPTLHKDFLKYLDIATMSANRVAIVTNGSNTDITMKLIEYAKDDLIYLGVSVDKYHDSNMVDQRVVDTIRKVERSAVDGVVRKNLRIHDFADDGVSPVGRAKQLPASHYSKKYIGGDICFSSSIFITPLGEIYHCSCKTRQYGTVDNPKIPWYYAEYITSTCEIRDDWKGWLKHHNVDWTVTTIAPKSPRQVILMWLDEYCSIPVEEFLNNVHYNHTRIRNMLLNNTECRIDQELAQALTKYFDNAHPGYWLNVQKLWDEYSAS